ncbi:uncharacterized protein LACBIDRAFT_235377, partial [Laccaria bicolor S238N-H82]
GTNLQALINALNTPRLPSSQIVLVLSNRKAAYGLTRASLAIPSIPTTYLALQPYLSRNPSKSRSDYDAEIARIVLSASPDLVVLAGWMHILSESFLDLMGPEIPIINLHPALPGAFDGANAIERAFEAWKRGEITRSGCMVHRVVKEVDKGEPIIVREVEFKEGESIEEFEERLHAVEHEIIVEGAKKVLEEC